VSWKHLLDRCVIQKMREDLSACCHLLLNTIRLDPIVMSSTRNSRLMQAELQNISRYHHLTEPRLGNTLSRRNS